MPVDAVIELLRERIGLEVEAVGATSVRFAVQRCMKACGAVNEADYLRRLLRGEAELQRLIDAVVVHETWFFRDEGPFAFLAEWAGERRHPRVLSAPCASGEEAWSIALTLKNAGVEAHIEGVDICPRLLQAAQAGRYGGSSFRQVPAEQTGLQQEGDAWCVPVGLAVHWRPMNMLAPDFAPPERYDAVFCRNLLIYLTPLARLRVLRTVDSLLPSGGVLFLGHAERPEGLRYTRISRPNAFAWVKP